MESASFVVVGGSAGIGLEITRRLAAKGCPVVVISRSAVSVADLPGVTHLEADVTQDEIDIGSLPERVKGLVYCPGSIRLRPFHRLKEADFLADLQINLLGAVKAIQACLPGLKKADNPSSIVLFSTVAVGTGMPFHASIASAKGAIEGLTRALAAEFAPKIRVNAIAPSLTDTPLARTLLSDEGKRAAAAATYLLEDASSWITGQVLAVDGGMGALRTFK